MGVLENHYQPPSRMLLDNREYLAPVGWFPQTFSFKDGPAFVVDKVRIVSVLDCVAEL